MKLTTENPAILSRLFEGQFGLEKESLRVMQDTGLLAASAHPFHHPNIVQDFAENQTEINTDVCSSWKDARQACEDLTIYMLQALDEQGEVLWPFSNPSIIRTVDDIPVLRSGSKDAIEYRNYLMERYGKYKMVFSGIHYNFSFTDDLLQEEYALHPDGLTFHQFKDRFYLDLVQKILRFGWLIDILLNASPIYDGSLLSEEDLGSTEFAGQSSMRNSATGYWNFFTPYLDYSSVEAYAHSIQKYVDEGLLRAPSELYFPVRVKPAGKYSLEALVDQGISHIELRMVDLNPYEFSGISEDDAWFCHLFLIFLASIDSEPLSWKDQIYSQQNFKNACQYRLEQSRILLGSDSSIDAASAALEFLSAMHSFFAPIDPVSGEMLERQMKKLTEPAVFRLAQRVRKDFADFARQGLEQARWLQKKALAAKRSDLLENEEKGSI